MLDTVALATEMMLVIFSDLIEAKTGSTELDRVEFILILALDRFEMACRATNPTAAPRVEFFDHRKSAMV